MSRERNLTETASISLAALSLCNARHGYSLSAPCEACHADIVALVDAPAPAGGEETKLREISDVELEEHIGNVAADCALAYRYEHNAHLRSAIEAHFGRCVAERDRRAAARRPVEAESPEVREEDMASLKYWLGRTTAPWSERILDVLTAVAARQGAKP